MVTGHAWILDLFIMSCHYFYIFAWVGQQCICFLLTHHTLHIHPQCIPSCASGHIGSCDVYSEDPYYLCKQATWKEKKKTFTPKNSSLEFFLKKCFNRGNLKNVMVGLSTRWHSSSSHHLKFQCIHRVPMYLYAYTYTHLQMCTYTCSYALKYKNHQVDFVPRNVLILGKDEGHVLNEV